MPVFIRLVLSVLLLVEVKFKVLKWEGLTARNFWQVD